MSAQQPEYFVVRIYRRDADDPARIEGTLEIVVSGCQQPFASMHELWALLRQTPPANDAQPT